ncbi:MAG: hypothetical protein ACI4A8_00840 [Muribaculaceae bacterium]
MRSDNYPFREWVPRPIGILVLLMMFVPPTFSGGTYLSNITEMSSSMAMLSEDIQLASFFTSIGMCLFPPFMVPFLQARRTKPTYLVCFTLLIVLNAICYVSTSLPLLLTACLLTGFVRVVAMLNCTFTIAPYLTGMDTLSMFTMSADTPTDVQYGLERKRTFLMPVLYFFILFVSQLSNVLTAWFAYEYWWQDAYIMVIGMLMVAMLLVIVTMTDEEKKKSYRIEWCKVPEMLLMAIALCSMAFVLVYGKTLDWLESDSIVWALALFMISCGAFLSRSLSVNREAYLPLRVFRYRNVTLSMLLFMATMVFNSSNNFVLTFAKLSTVINNVQAALLSWWAIVGCLMGLILSVLLIVKKFHFRALFCLAFLFMAASNAYLYFQYQTMGLFSNLWLPMVLNFTGLLMLYSLVAAWGMKGLPSRYLATFVFLMIWMRNVIAPVVGSSIYTNMLYHRQQYYVSRLSQNVDSENPLTGAIPLSILKSRVMKQSMLVAMKEISGNTVIYLVVASVAVLLLPYRKGETT